MAAAAAAANADQEKKPIKTESKRINKTLEESLARLKRNDFSFKRLSLEGLTLAQTLQLAETMAANTTVRASCAVGRPPRTLIRR